MKKYFFLSIFFIFVCASPGIFSLNDWESYSYSLVINDIDGDLDYIYAAANTGIIAIDRLTDAMNTIMTFNNVFYDFPINKIIADRYEKFNVYFTGREYIYHYDWFNDSIIRSQITGFKASGVEHLGIDAQYVYVQLMGITMRISKYDFASNNWERVSDTNGVFFKESVNPENQLYILPHYRYFNNIKYDFTCYYQFMNTVWAGTKGAGIYRIDLDSGNETHLIHGTGSVDNQAMAMDSTGRIWIAGTRTISITRYDPENNSFEYFPIYNYPGIVSKEIVSISCSRDNVLFGTNDGYAFFYSLKDSQFRDIKHIKGNIVFRSLPLSNDTFIVSNNLGLAVIDVKARTFTQKDAWYLPSVIDMEIIGDSIYIVASNTLYRSDRDLNNIESVSFDFPTFNIFQIDRWENIIMVMDNAYIHINEDTLWSSYPLVGFFGDIMGMDADSNYIWICGRDGLGRFSKDTKTWKIYNKQNARMPATFTYNVIIHNGFLYGSTGKAFFKFNYTNPLTDD